MFRGLKIAALLIPCALMLCACGGQSSAAADASSAAESSQITAETTVQTAEETTVGSAKAEETTAPTAESTASETTALTTTEITTASAEIATTITVPDSVVTITNEIAKTVNITDITAMAASMIGGEDGISFKVNGNKFEIYKFSSGHEKLKEAESGKVTLTLQGFGDYESLSAVNGDYMMIYSTADDAVIKAFRSYQLKN